MRYHLDTIPVWDAYRQDCECPLCLLKKKLEEEYTVSFLGGSVMEPDTRVEVNEKGFCERHFRMLYETQNRLGLALISHTRLREVSRQANAPMEELKKQAAEAASLDAVTNIKESALAKMGKTSGRLFSSMEQLEKFLEKAGDSCVVCDRLDNNLNRYAYTILHLYFTDNEFAGVFARSRGFCLPHFRLFLQMARQNKSPKECAKLLETILPLMQQNLERLDNELKTFTLKFDYRNKDMPWGNSKDALPRVLQKLKGSVFEG